MRASFARVVGATVVKDLLLARRYGPNLVGRLLDVGIRVLFFLMLSRLTQVNAEHSPLGSAMSGRDLAIFFQGALVLLVFNTTAVNAPIEAVGRDLYNGTLEYLFSSPSSRYGYLVGTVLASAAINVVIVGPLFVVLWAYAQPDALNVLMMLAVCALVLVTNVAMGVMIALLALIWRQVGSIASVLTVLIELLAGAYLPVSALPWGLDRLAMILPQTWGFDLIRAYSFGPRWSTLYPVWAEWLILASVSVAFVAASIVLLRLAERQAKRSGLHLI